MSFCILCCLVSVSLSADWFNVATVLSSCMSSFSCTNMISFVPRVQRLLILLVRWASRTSRLAYRPPRCSFEWTKLPSCAQRDKNRCMSVVSRNSSDILVLYGPFYRTWSKSILDPSYIARLSDLSFHTCSMQVRSALVLALATSSSLSGGSRLAYRARRSWLSRWGRYLRWSGRSRSWKQLPWGRTLSFLPSRCLEGSSSPHFNRGRRTHGHLQGPETLSAHWEYSTQLPSGSPM